MQLNDWYAQFRSGKGYAIVLIAIMAGWMLADVITNFDPHLSFFNVFLSMEASLSFPLIMIHQDQIRKEQEAMQQKQLKYMVHLMEAVLALLQERSASQHEQIVGIVETAVGNSPDA